jgi:hypothetical protein
MFGLEPGKVDPPKTRERADRRAHEPEEAGDIIPFIESVPKRSKAARAQPTREENGLPCSGWARKPHDAVGARPIEQAEEPFAWEDARKTWDGELRDVGGHDECRSSSDYPYRTESGLPGGMTPHVFPAKASSAGAFGDPGGILREALGDLPVRFGSAAA